MIPEHWQKIEQLFHAALEREASQRRAFLNESCGGDADLQSEVESLLAYHEKASNLMEAPAVESTAEYLFADEQNASMVGRRIGPYHVIDEIGQGGMGAVYLAVRADDAYRKQVTIKLVKRGMDTDAILRRFRNERQILADLDHPNIAKLLDGGTTEDGLPYLLMDYIEGLPINDYCDTHKLSIPDRLKLFRIVCSAVHHAHQRHIVHLDLKPNNILVTHEGVPKLLDFGIAKLLNPEVSSQTRESTLMGLRPLTPEYASPEQVRGETITPASDIYSLGVVLYELLTGQRPYPTHPSTPQEIERVICQSEPEKPSTIIHRIEPAATANGSPTPTTERVRATCAESPGQLSHRLAGDLDNIVLMALRKEPARRYTSVEQFSEDIRCYLEDRPVIAQGDTLWYRSRKFIKRNKAYIITTTLSMVMAIVLVIGFYLLAPRDRAVTKAIDSIAVLPLENRSNDPEQDYFAEGMTEALITELANIRALRVIPQTSVMQYKGVRKPLPEIAGTLRVDAVVKGSVLRSAERVQITVQMIHAATDRQLWALTYDSDLRDILTLQKQVVQAIARQIRIKLTPQEQARLTNARSVHPVAYRDYLKGRYFWNKRTKEGLIKSMEYFQKASLSDPSYAPAYTGLADGYNVLAAISVRPPKEMYPKSKVAITKALALDDTLAEAHASLGLIKLLFDWDWAGAEQEFQQAIKLNPSYGPAQEWYARWLQSQGRQDEAIVGAKRAQELDPVSVIIDFHMGWTFFYARQYDEAIKQYKKTLEMDTSFDLARSYLGLAYAQKRMYKESMAELKEAVARSNGDPFAIAYLGYTHALMGNRKEALKRLSQLRERSTRYYVSPIHIARIYIGLGERDRAFHWLQKAYDERYPWLINLKVDPIYDVLRSDPRFVDLLRRVGLAR